MAKTSRRAIGVHTFDTPSVGANFRAIRKKEFAALDFSILLAA